MAMIKNEVTIDMLLFDSIHCYVFFIFYYHVIVFSLHCLILLCQISLYCLFKFGNLEFLLSFKFCKNVATISNSLYLIFQLLSSPYLRLFVPPHPPTCSVFLSGESSFLNCRNSDMIIISRRSVETFTELTHLICLLFLNDPRCCSYIVWLSSELFNMGE